MIRVSGEHQSDWYLLYSRGNGDRFRIGCNPLLLVRDEDPGPGRHGVDHEPRRACRPYFEQPITAVSKRERHDDQGCDAGSLIHSLRNGGQRHLFQRLEPSLELDLACDSFLEGVQPLIFRVNLQSLAYEIQSGFQVLLLEALIDAGFMLREGCARFLNLFLEPFPAFKKRRSRRIQVWRLRYEHQAFTKSRQRLLLFEALDFVQEPGDRFLFSLVRNFLAYSSEQFLKLRAVAVLGHNFPDSLLGLNEASRFSECFHFRPEPIDSLLPRLVPRKLLKFIQTPGQPGLAAVRLESVLQQSQSCGKLTLQAELLCTRYRLPDKLIPLPFLNNLMQSPGSFVISIYRKQPVE